MRTPGQLPTPTRWEAIALLCAMLLGWVHAELQAPAAPGFVHAWVWQLVFLVVSYVLSAAFAKKPQPPQPEVAEVPRVGDGRRVVRIYGTVWIKDPTQLAMLQVDPPDPIKSKGGKK